MSLINKIEEEFAALRFFLVSALGEHIHIHSGVDDALDGVKKILADEGRIPADDGTPANPAASEAPEAQTAPPSAPAAEEVPTPADLLTAEQVAKTALDGTSSTEK